jgi:hypothetical protein
MIVSATSAAYIAGLLVNGFTLVKPDRPSWVAFGLALIIAVIATCILAFATLPADYTLTRQDYAQIFIVGIFAAGGAAGGSVTQSSATAKRDKATATKQQSEPDVMNASPNATPEVKDG